MTGKRITKVITIYPEEDMNVCRTTNVNVIMVLEEKPGDQLSLGMIGTRISVQNFIAIIVVE